MSVLGPLNPPRNFYEVWSLIRALATALLKLSFTDNFDSFEQVVTIPAATEVSIRNLFRNRVPSRYIITNHDGNGIIRRGDTEWSNDLVYLKNVSSTTTTTVTVVFMGR